MSDSVIHCSIELDQPGRQVGRLEVPRSTNTAAWASTFVPIVSVAGGTGPTVLVLGGCHGDEYEGQVAALKLARELAPGQVSGRVIIVPCLSVEASRAATRVWPSGANLNRSFPGSPTGAPDEQLADFLTTELFPRADAVVDIHSGGRSLHFVPSSFVHLAEEPMQRRAMLEAALAWNTDYHVVYSYLSGTGLLVAEAERQGRTVLGTELGGGGSVPSQIHTLAERGLKNVLRAFGVVEGEVETRASLGLPDAMILRQPESDSLVSAPESGILEVLVGPGDVVHAGQPLGQLHFVERPDREPEPITSRIDGIVVALRAIPATEQGDTVAMIGQVVDRAVLLRPSTKG
jgi:N-alpha-acetyl-L-2,4-diaminobutyrate deacetylase